MRFSVRLFVLFGTAALIAVPVLTMHAVLGHLAGPEAVHFKEPSVDGGLAVIALLVVLAAVPVALAIPALARGASALHTLRALNRRWGTEVVAGGICYSRVESLEVAVFTAGVWRPRIYATTAAELRLSTESLVAALRHEQGHLAARDTWWRPALLTLDAAFGRLPRVRSAVQAAVLQSEVAADDHALRCGASPLALFDAVATAASAPPASAGVAGSGARVRLERLAAAPIEFPAPRGPAWTAFVALGAWALAVPVAAHVAVIADFLCSARLGV